MSACGSQHEYEPDTRFCCKMTHWRQNGVGIAPVPEGWGGPTIREQVKDTIERSKANGYEPDYQGRAVLR